MARGQKKSGARSAGDWAERVAVLARNLWWTWNLDAQRLFAGLDPVEWAATNRNPLATLARLSDERRAVLAESKPFQDLLKDCERQWRDYRQQKSWFQRRSRGGGGRWRAAYFCAEFALHESFPQYSGGLGVLAGDHLKSASDLGVPLCAVGLLYRNGYYRQQFHQDGSTRAIFPEYDPAHWPIVDTGKRIDVAMGKRTVHARIWRVDVGRVPLYMLDTNLPENKPAEREITARLYGGDQEMRIRQEILLGVGGVRALAAVGERATVYHLNEGHAAFCTLERLRDALARGRSFEKAVEQVTASTVFTTHTPVPAGHDRFPPKLMRKYFGDFAGELGLSFDELMWYGREREGDKQEPFCMTVLALLLCKECNGVSKLHGEVSREMWQHVFEVSSVRNVPITHITNGVHTQTWLAPEMSLLYDKYLKPRWGGAGPEKNWWQKADRIPPEELWETRCLLRRKLVDFIRSRLAEQIARRCEPLDELRAALATFDEEALTIGFARRFATYKRAPLIFRNAKRLAAILNDAERPVQLVFAGKAHPADREGQQFAQEIYQVARKAGFRGRVALLEDYDMHIGRMLTSGCDVWLNNPRRPQEASGTSGMKPPLHGGLNCSILDGWWPEGYNRKNGWAIGDGTEARTPAAQDKRDAEEIYRLLEEEIVPEFYDRRRDGVPRKWVRRMVSALQSVCGVFNTHRMVAEYVDLYES